MLNLKRKICKCGNKALKNRRICYGCFLKRERKKKALKITKMRERKKVKKEKDHKVWKFSTADSKFSNFIRKRDGKCLRCGKTDFLQCSHFWSRVNYATRYDEDNCITLCYSCHYGNSNGWEYDQAGEYRDFMIKRLGMEKYNELFEKHRLRKSKRDAIIDVMNFLKNNDK